MKHITILLIIMLFFLQGITFANPKIPLVSRQLASDENLNSPMGSAIIKGQVKWASDGTPVAGAVVELHFPPDGSGPRKRYMTDASGSYYVAGLDEGKYHVILPGAVMHGDKATFVFVNEGQFYLQINNNTTTEVNFQVQKGCSISGKITHQNTGLPIKNAVIRLYHPDWRECFRLRSSTDSTGNYFIGGLDNNDEFYLHASGEIAHDVELSWMFATWDTILVGEYYNESPDRSGAKKVKIIGDQSGLNFTLTGAAIVGYVRRADNGNPVLRTQVMRYNENWEILDYANVDSGQFGFFFFKNLTSGSKFYLEATGWNQLENRQQYLPVFYDQAATREEAKLLTLTNELKEINFYLSEGFQIDGKVNRQDNGQPIAFSQVALFDAQWNHLNEVTTNSEGSYSVRASQGDYYIEATGWCDINGENQKLYTNEFYREAPDRAGALLIQITRDMNDINFTLQELLRITGKVTRQRDGAPINEGQIITYDENWNFVQETRTSPNGVFNFTGLDSAKSYYFEASGKVWWDFGAYGGWNQFYKPQFFSKTTSRDSAALVALSGAIPAIDFVLYDFEGYTISGKVSRQDNNNPIGFAGIEILDSNRNQMDFTITSSSGQYTTPKLAKGTYYVMATGYCESNGWRKLYQTEYYKESSNWEGATILSLDRDLTNIIFTLTEGMSISGTVRDYTTGATIAEAQIFVFDQQWQFAGEGRSNTFGAYNIPDLIAGDYYVQANGKIYKDMGGYGDFVALYHPSYYNGAYREQEAMPVRVDKNIESIDLTLSDINSYRISGDVRSASDQQPIAKTQIQLFDDNWQCVTHCMSFSNGHYCLQGIKAGKYYVKATGYCQENDNNVRRFQAVYYPGTSDSCQAKSIIVVEMMEHIDFLLNPYQVAVPKNNILSAPKSYQLKQNYPNPFNPTTTISYELPESQHVLLKVYDILGREVARLVDERKVPGIYKVNFDASHLPNGVYMYRLTAGEYSEVKKLVLIK